MKKGGHTGRATERIVASIAQTRLITQRSAKATTEESAFAWLGIFGMFAPEGR